MVSFPLTRRSLVLGAACLLPATAFAGEKIVRRKGDGPAPANLIRIVQSELSSRGFDPGPIDGLMGRRTRSAIRDFETANDLEVTGEISEPLLVALGLAQPAEPAASTEAKPETSPGN